MFSKLILITVFAITGITATNFGNKNFNTSNSTWSTCPENETFCPPQKLICYFTSWSTKREGKSAFKVSDIDPKLCTHIMFSFAILNSTTLKIEPDYPELDIGDGKLYEKVTALKSKGLKVSLSLGGWGDSANGLKYSQMINHGRSRSDFVHNTLKYLTRHNFDGLDIDWEYPKCWQGNCTVGPNSDKINFGNLIKELNVAFSSRGLLLSVAVSADAVISDQAYSISKFSKYLDWIGVMTYDYHPASRGKTGHHSPYMGVHPNTVDSIQYWLQHGVSAQKLIVGIPLYGRSFTLADSSMHGISAPATIGHPAEYTKEAGYIAYFEFCIGWEYKTLHAIGSYAFKGDQWVSYNDLEIIQDKAEYIRQFKLGGAMVWALDLDDFNGEFCNQGKYPLMTTLKNILLPRIIN